MLVGLGFSLAFKAGQTHPHPYVPGLLNLKILLGFCVLIIALLSSLVIVPFNRFTITRKFGIYLLLLNIAFTALSMAIEFSAISLHIPGTV